ncbi:AMP-binding protein [Kribbella qitaiheensis]|uniref:AMP-binding protein n=1 Tax=Kribbella qitaiheensis TaxID=1544730 RepID=A0A7G6X9K4_9ACTN|nr:AMP-binding protein [Kribbella qitaiheensis]
MSHRGWLPGCRETLAFKGYFCIFSPRSLPACLASRAGFGSAERVRGGTLRSADAGPKSIAVTIATLAAARPGRTAVVHAGETLTYGELIERADSVAAALSASGAGPDNVVALEVPRGTEFVIGALGVLRAGAAYLPVDPALPAARRDYLLTDAKPTAVLRPGPAQRGHQHLDSPGLPSRRSRLRDLHVRLDRTPQRRADPPLRALEPDRLAAARPRSDRDRPGVVRLRPRLRRGDDGDLDDAGFRRNLGHPDRGAASQTYRLARLPPRLGNHGRLRSHRSGRGTDDLAVARQSALESPVHRRRSADGTTAGHPALHDLQRLRAHRDDGGRNLRPGRPRRRRTNDRQGHRRRHPADPRPSRRTGDNRRTLHRRCRCCPRLPRPTRTDRGSVRHRSGTRSSLPNRRPGLTPRGRRTRLPGPGRRPGPDPRPAGRAGRGRDRAR